MEEADSTVNQEYERILELRNELTLEELRRVIEKDFLIQAWIEKVLEVL